MRNILFFLFIFQVFLIAKEKNIEIILKRNVFKPIITEVKKIERPEPVRRISEPENIDKFYSLLGTIVFDEKEKSIAILEDIKKKEVVFVHTGDILENFKIEEIKKEGIIYQTITEEKYFFTTSGIRQIEFTHPKIYFSIKLKSFIEELKENNELLNSLRTEFVNIGKNYGYKIEGIKEGSLIEKAGILNNDVILKINGVKIENPKICFEISEDILKNGKNKVNIEILRDGKLLNLFYFLE